MHVGQVAVTFAKRRDHNHALFLELAREIMNTTPSFPPSDDDLREFDRLARNELAEHPYKEQAALLRRASTPEWYPAFTALLKFCCPIVYPVRKAA